MLSFPLSPPRSLWLVFSHTRIYHNPRFYAAFYLAPIAAARPYSELWSHSLSLYSLLPLPFHFDLLACRIVAWSRFSEPLAKNQRLFRRNAAVDTEKILTCPSTLYTLDPEPPLFLVSSIKQCHPTKDLYSSMELPRPDLQPDRLFFLPTSSSHSLKELSSSHW